MTFESFQFCLCCEQRRKGKLKIICGVNNAFINIEIVDIFEILKAQETISAASSKWYRLTNGIVIGYLPQYLRSVIYDLYCGRSHSIAANDIFDRLI